MIADQIEGIRKEIEELKAQIGEKVKLIDSLYASCKHVWRTPVMVTTKENNTFGGGSYDKRTWKRECAACGKIEITGNEKLIAVPNFDNTKPKIDCPFFNFGGS